MAKRLRARTNQTIGVVVSNKNQQVLDPMRPVCKLEDRAQQEALDKIMGTAPPRTSVSRGGAGGWVEFPAFASNREARACAAILERKQRARAARGR